MRKYLDHKYFKIGSYIAVALLSATAGSQLFPRTVNKTKVKEKIKWKTKTEVKFKDRIVYRDKIKTKTVTRKITRNDGTIIEETENETSESKKGEESTRSSERNKSEGEIVKEKVVIVDKSKYHLGIDVNLADSDFNFGPMGYDIFVQGRIGSTPIFIGPVIELDKDFKFEGAGIKFSWEF